MRDCTFSDSLNSVLQVTVSLLQSEDEIVVGPLWEKFLQCRQIAHVFLLQQAKLSLIV